MRRACTAGQCQAVLPCGGPLSSISLQVSGIEERLFLQ